MDYIKVSICQINSIIGDLKNNIKKIIDFANNCKDSDFIVFPELSISGYPPEDLLFKKHFIEDCKKTLKLNLNKFPSDSFILIGHPDFNKNDEVVNRLSIILNGKIISQYDKINLPNYSVFDEKRYFKEGDSIKSIWWDKVNFSFNICEDIWVEDNLITASKKLFLSDIIFNISASPYHINKHEERIKIFSKYTKENNCILVYCNLVGGQDELIFDGNSFVLKGDEIIAKGKSFEEDIVDVYINVKELFKEYEYSEFEIEKFNKIKRTAAIKVKKPYKINKPKKNIFNVNIHSEEEEIFEALKLAVKDYVHKNGFKKVIVGISGGIDSALTATICALSLGKENVVGISMPSHFTSTETKSDARILAENLGIEFYEIPIANIFQTYLNQLKPYFKDLPFNVAEENLQARIRGNILMAFSNKFGYLVITTGNKSELTVGYATIYGDMAGGFALLKDVPKMLVYKIAEFINKKYQKEIIPNSTIERAPSAELRPNQKDEDSLVPYPLLDKFLKLFIEEDKDLNYFDFLNEKDLKKLIRLVYINEYKRRQAPVGPKITKRAFGKDRRYPITNHYNEIYYR